MKKCSPCYYRFIDNDFKNRSGDEKLIPAKEKLVIGDNEKILFDIHAWQTLAGNQLIEMNRKDVVKYISDKTMITAEYTLQVKNEAASGKITDCTVQ